MHFILYRYSTSFLYASSGLISVRQLYILHTVLKKHKSLAFNPIYSSKRRNYSVAPIWRVKTTFAKHQYNKQSEHLYNQINKILQIYPLKTYDCKKKIMQWLKTITIKLKLYYNFFFFF
ncbi:unnamed protein product [Parnassius mnemosyne]|uniref:Ribosomal protein S10 n=1 Tax=Parnassius mnemosyne TaxID=213953 RepID=A0AAV1LUF4_9NEOP